MPYWEMLTKMNLFLVYTSKFVITKWLVSQFHCCDANQLEKDQRSISLVPKLKPLGAHLATPDASWDFLQVVLARTFVALSPAKIHCWPMAARLNEKPSIHKQQFRRKLCSWQQRVHTRLRQGWCQWAADHASIVASYVGRITWPCGWASHAV